MKGWLGERCRKCIPQLLRQSPIEALLSSRAVTTDINPFVDLNMQYMRRHNDANDSTRIWPISCTNASLAIIRISSKPTRCWLVPFEVWGLVMIVSCSIHPVARPTPLSTLYLPLFELVGVEGTGQERFDVEGL